MQGNLKWNVVPSTDLVEQIEIAMTLLGRFKYRIEISEFFLREITDFCRSYQHKRSAHCEALWGKKIWLPTHRINFGSYVTVRPPVRITAVKENLGGQLKRLRKDWKQNGKAWLLF